MALPKLSIRLVISSMEIITGYTGENHVTSADDASLYRGILGTGDYVLDVGNKFAATIIDNNTVRIMDGDLVIQGHQARIRANDYEEVTIDNGTPGQKRNDLIVARYQKNTTTGIESITLEVVKGTPGETATDPDIIQEDLSTGGTQRDFALYRVSLNGLALESVTSLFTVIPNLKDFMTHQAESANKHIHSRGTNWIRFDNGWQICTGTLRFLSTNLSPGGLLTLTLTFPQPFIAAPHVSFGIEALTHIYNALINYDAFMQTPTTDGVEITVVHQNRNNAITNITVHIQAIGRWK